ncbi:DeoR/GlpR family DNA-binding transcription regulator [Kineococcus sp. SYSU DK018]|uniref:DeoR/GlpR family DNA-binding transcription regulator n=1 Tax=Kineococcus sp. SYSU DK018 TaxID=3383139 RepID=UPI003D7E55B0
MVAVGEEAQVSLAGTPDAEARRARLRETLLSQGVVLLADAARRFEVHPMTIRRDFEHLENSGLARRVRGGIVSAGGEGFAQRRNRRAAAKRRIGRKLLELVEPGCALGLDSSTTVHALAEVVAAGQGISVVTTGLEAFDTLRGRGGVRCYLTGGEHEEENSSLVGPLAVNALRTFHLDVCFLSALGVHPVTGTSESTLEQASVKEAMASASARVVLAVDSSKLGSRSRVRALPLERADVLVTELDPADERLEEYRHRVGELR